MNSKAFHRSTLSLALGLCLASLAPLAVAQDGSVAGTTASGAQVTVTNPAGNSSSSLRDTMSRPAFPRALNHGRGFHRVAMALVKVTADALCRM